MTPHTAHPSAYDDLGTPEDMRADCRSLDPALRAVLDRIGEPAPSLAFDEQRRPSKSHVDVSEAAARLASAIYGD